MNFVVCLLNQSGYRGFSVPSEANATRFLGITVYAHRVPVNPAVFEKPVPLNIIKTVPIGIRTLTRNKTYTIKTEEDVEAFIEEIRKELVSKLEKDTVIKLN